MSEVQADTAPVAPQPVTIVNEKPPTMEETMAAVYDKSHPETQVGRDRDSGQFKSKEPTVSPEAKVEAPAEKVSDQAPVEKAAEPAKPAIGRPQSWSADLDQWWNELPPERQEFLSKRESEATQKISQLGQKAKTAEQYQAVIDRYKHVLEQGTPLDQQFANLLATKEALKSRPVESIKWLADQLGVNLSQFGQQPQIGQPESNHFDTLTQRIADLERQLSETAHKLTSREQSEDQAREKTLTQQIEEHSKGNPDWAELEQDIVAQVHAIRAVDPDRALADPMSVIKEAEQRAIKLNDKIREKRAAAEKEKAKAEEEAKAKKKADEAKRLASLNAKSTTGTAPKAAAKSLEAQMEEVYDRLNGRG